MRIKIEDIRDFEMNGVEVRFFDDEEAVKAENFNWFPARESIPVASTDIMLGRLEAEKADIVFSRVEYHDDTEIFYYYKGAPVICFCEISDGKADMSTLHIVRLQEQAIVKINSYIGHVVPAVEEDEAAEALVISSQSMKTYNVDLEETVIGS